jgi:hypothetical protein
MQRGHQRVVCGAPVDPSIRVPAGMSDERLVARLGSKAWEVLATEARTTTGPNHLTGVETGSQALAHTISLELRAPDLAS